MKYLKLRLRLPAEPTPAIEAKPEIMDFYVDAVTLSIREQPDPNAYPDVDKQLYRGDKVHLLEKGMGAYFGLLRV